MQSTNRCGVLCKIKLKDIRVSQQNSCTFMSANSSNSLYIVNLPDRYWSRRKAKLLVGPSEMTLSTNSRSKKYSRMSGISKAGFISFSLSANTCQVSEYRGLSLCRYHCCHRIPGTPPLHQCQMTTRDARQGS